MVPRFLLVGAAALALAACGDSAEDEIVLAEEGTMATDQGAMDRVAADNDAAMPDSAQEFASMQAASDMYEIEAGKLAQENGSAQPVKDFGAMMERDHTKSTADLKDAAGQVDGVTVAPELNAKQQSDLDALRSAGENFDSVYKQQQVAAHRQALSMLQNYARNGDAEPLKEFAGNTATVVEGHLNEARSLP